MVLFVFGLEPELTTSEPKNHIWLFPISANRVSGTCSLPACMHVGMHVCGYMCLCEYMYIRVHMFSRVCMYMYKCVCLCVSGCAFVPCAVCVYMCRCVYRYDVCACVRACVCVHMHMYLCVCGPSLLHTIIEEVVSRETLQPIQPKYLLSGNSQKFPNPCSKR